MTVGSLPDFDQIRAECLMRAEEQVGESGGPAIERMREARTAMLEAASVFADKVAALDGQTSAKRSMPELLTRAAEQEAEAVRKRANALFQQQMSSIDVTATSFPDFDQIRAECLKEAEQQVNENGGEAIERMREARAATQEAASVFADAVDAVD